MFKQDYVSAMGEAAEQYLSQFKYAHPMPAQWRWEECWKAMQAAAPEPTLTSPARVGHVHFSVGSPATGVVRAAQRAAVRQPGETAANGPDTLWRLMAESRARQELSDRAALALTCLEWLEAKAQDSVVTASFELDGGVHVTVETLGGREASARYKNTVLEAMLQLIEQECADPGLSPAPAWRRLLRRITGVFK